ncbi:MULTISPECIES: alpha/beta hydrolase-fold protein [unclassified Streptomyces]|uniref:alpha/beta hydrolase n=1 Tax=unclassified Streptomyces TaxID=2593676 RepID=UPI0005F9A059|nr:MULTISPECIES: alpha/beta hydrolase-fold protein [unclassified Streptomyces]KJY31507.1 esterase [Streptomyces sp. NRRL S-495]KOV27567.1 esterase [Streptomyces sp. XY431]
MQLTGTPFFVCTVVLVPISIAVAMWAWARVKGPEPVRVLSRLAMIVFCQATAVVMVFVMVNNANLIYGNWDDLLGTGKHVRAVPVVPPADPAPGAGQGASPAPGASAPAGDAAHPPANKVQQAFRGVDDPKVPNDVQKTDLKGQLSGVDGEVLVWLPPQYNDPAYKDKKFPVVELIPGFPGSSSTWYGTLKVSEQLKPLMQQGKVAPFILVSPRTLLLGNRTDAGCTDVPGKVNADTWLTRDVPQMVLDNFRADPSADRWAIAGYSAGAHCATKLSLAHPNRYRAGISLSGYNDPAKEPDSLVGKDAKLREANNPVTIVKAAPQPPKVSLYVSGNKGDGYEDGQAVAAAAKAPTTVQVVETTGPHTSDVWKDMVPGVFEWLTGIIPAQ